jgi:hypothetical protein
VNRPPGSASGSALITSTRAVPVAMACLLGALAFFLAWQYAMAPSFKPSFMAFPAGAQHFREALGLPRVELGLEAYRVGFRAGFAAIWAAYLMTIVAGFLGAPLPGRRRLWAVIGGVAAFAAVLWPPSFSCDVYGYVAYGRMQVLHGWNPYATTQQALLDAHDPVGRFLVWNIASPYGPLWTLLSVAVVSIVPTASVFGQVLGMKLIGAAALMAAGWVGRRVAERLAPGRGDLTLLAIGLNPLFVIEGVGNAHNDLLMMALVIASLHAALRGQDLRAALWAGAAGGIKFLPFLLVPWLVLGPWRERPLAWTRRLRDGAMLGLAAMLPVAIGYLPYWFGLDTLGGLRQRWREGRPGAGGTGHELWLQAGALVLVYTGATLFCLRGDRNRLLTAWMIVASAVFLLTAGTWQPWYLSWVLGISLLCWERRSVAFSYVALCFAVALTLRYTVPGSV